jgi:hypothetical protein
LLKTEVSLNGQNDFVFSWNQLMIVAKFGSNWFSGFREEYLWKSLQTDDDGQTPSDGNSSHGILASCKTKN